MNDSAKQLEAWTGEFGNDYIDRNEATEERIAGKTRAWARMLRPLAGSMPLSILEVGANIGLNLRALRRVVVGDLFALEPNEKARKRLVTDGVVGTNRVLAGGAEAIPLGDAAVDMVFTSTVLIHVGPDNLLSACREIHRVADRYILCNEYFSVHPETIEYRERTDLLFKRDFGSFWLDNFPDLQLIDYGFFWRRADAMDNTTWWLFAKSSNARIAV